MTQTTRKLILRYGIAIDLVIVATGAGMLISSPWLLVTMYLLATAASAWKGGWKGGLLAFGLSILLMFVAFPGQLRAAQLLLYVIPSGVLLLAVAMREMRSGQAAVAVEVPVAEAPHFALVPLAPLPPLAPVEPISMEAQTADDPEESTGGAVVINKDRAAREKRSRQAQQRAEAKRARLAKEAEERETRERELRERLEAERRAEAERAAAAERERVAREAAEREAREQELKARMEAEAQERLEQERLERERVEAEHARVEAERARLARELEERETREQELKALVEAEARGRLEQERLERERAESERARAEAERERAETERALAEAARARVEAERERLTQELAARDARERELHEQLDAERKSAEERIAAMQKEAMQKEAEAKASHVAAAPAAAAPAPARRREPPAPQPSTSLFGKVAEWFGAGGDRRTVNLVNRRVTNNAPQKPAARPPVRRGVAAPAARARKPRLLLVERRRGTADTAVPKMHQRGVEMEVVERWVDAVDEMFRFRPDALFIDVDHPEFDLIHRTITDQNPKMPLVFTGTLSSTAPAVARLAPWVIRPYDLDELARIAQQAMSRPADFAEPRGLAARAESAPVAAASVTSPKRVERTDRVDVVSPVPRHADRTVTNDTYEVTCFNCRIDFNAIDADWCSCLTRERTLVCTNCLTCFCKASAAYKEKFWIEAPPRLFERKNAEAQRQQQSLPDNVAAAGVQRPLVLCVDDDMQIQAIVSRICTNLGYGTISAGDGQAGLALAREYQPNLILSDAFMPKLDGREMCRILKEEPLGATCKMVVMTGLYTDTKYRSEAVKRFHIDDYIAKPVAVTDLINLLQKHLEGVSGPPVQSGDATRSGDGEAEPSSLDALDSTDPMDAMDAMDSMNGVPLADLLDPPDEPARALTLVPPLAPDAGEVEAQASASTGATTAAPHDGYEVCCFNCQKLFDATRVEWCHCVGRDNTLVCPECNGCFCKAPASYKERFWIDAPPSLFERKMIGSKRSLGSRGNPAPNDVKRPLILLVEDDENVQLIVRTVVTNMGYGFVVGANGQEGLLLARQYGPELILSDAFMPKLDGREMCRLLKEDPQTAQSKAIIMTGLYTDRKYRNEALSYFKVDDYVAKPLAVDDLIKLFKKHLPHAVSAVN